MPTQARALIDRLAETRRLDKTEWEALLRLAGPEDHAHAAALAWTLARSIFGDAVYCRGVVEFTNHCVNNCRYCGIRRSNLNLARYRLDEDQILACCEAGFALGAHTFVLQGGEDPWCTDERLETLLGRILTRFPEAAITLSLGERDRTSYERLFAAGARRYLLRHETADPGHYLRLHPRGQRFARRMACLRDLKAIGFQTGCGMMVGAPFQTFAHLAADMAFMQDFRPHMIGMGPFLPHHATPFRNCPAGDPELTLFLLSLCRLMLPEVLLPATTALRSLMPDGLVRGVAAGCNVVMPNLTPAAESGGYSLYDGKLKADDIGENIKTLDTQLHAIGARLVIGRGDWGEHHKEASPC